MERFGTKMLSVDVPGVAAAPLLGEQEKFETFMYGGAAIFSSDAHFELVKDRSDRQIAFEVLERLLDRHQ